MEIREEGKKDVKEEKDIKETKSTQRAFAFFGCSCSGKTTIIKHILSNYREFVFSVSYTTRKMREGEKHGIDYFFVSKKEFEEKIKEGFFVEYTFFNENYYGTPKNQGDTRHIVIYDCDKKGIECFSSNLKNIKFVYVHANEDEILERLKQRKNNTEEEINARKKTMKESMEFVKTFKFDFIVETSKSINLTLNEVDFIISTYFL